jgi:ribonuclease HI
MKIEVYSDGSATIATKPGGYGYVVVIDGKKITEGNGYMDKATNNDAELEAAIQGLAMVLKMRIEGKIPIGAHEIYLVSDSQIVLGWVDGTHRFKQKHKRHKFEQLQHVVKKLNVKTRWVQGHSGDEHNERCDKLANLARKQLEKDDAKEEQKKVSKHSLIGKKLGGTFCIWYKGVLKVIDFETNSVENYDQAIHGKRESRLETK